MTTQPLPTEDPNTPDNHPNPPEVAPLKRRSEQRARGKLLQVRLSQEELNEVRGKARSCGVTAASYVRTVALGEKLKVVADQRAMLELMHLRADMGRVGGLLKLWLTNEERFDKERGGVGIKDVRDVLHRIEDTEAKIRMVLEQL